MPAVRPVETAVRPAVGPVETAVRPASLNIRAVRPGGRRTRGGSGGAGSPPRQPEFVNEFIMSLSPAGRPAEKSKIS